MSISNSSRSVFTFLLAFFGVATFAIGATTPPSPEIAIVSKINASILFAAGNVLPQAVLWLGSFMAIQFVLTNFALLKSGADIEAVFGKLIGSLAWFGFCIYLLNNGPALIESVGISILNKFTPNIPTPTSIVTGTLSLSGALLAAVAVFGTSILGSGNASLGIVAVVFFFAVLAIGLYMALKIILLYIELSLIVALAPLSFSLLGLNALKDQGIAPFKSLISLTYRIILLGIVCTAFTQVAYDAQVAILALKWKNPLTWGDNFEIILQNLAAVPICAFFVYKSDSIAASLAGGGSSLGTADVASSAAAGAAAGAALGSAGGGVAGLAAKVPQSMSAVVGNMMGSGGGSLQNVSAGGAGGPGGSRPMEPVASLSPQVGSKSPTPQFPTNKFGAPQPREGGGGQTVPAQSPADATEAKATENKAKTDSRSSLGSGAAIEGAKADRLNDTLDAINANLGSQGRRSLADSALAFAQTHSHEKSQTNVSISPHHE